ncbi:MULTISPECIES: flavodoxin [unclassified Enterococcus]|uniref:flavodoxin n=1 Tax=unclassified Enterococcus TaxID=2608891 RepID=UPI001551FBF1|nr:MULTISPECIES: flavodoxin [unclassified Enterococcus]MBS7576367.1 flavodoxin [Enterococcus sp. MMGLQ5-2]MBS7583599.1 flavodoxin [Enterococcus sp. MMGLQ5-1]NPD11461.1 flavodoxin [Enterococcus sp. MMGLQ5-1]NPD36205.1 flavodoxin [Enterococcus sp. MMGLQ5-2]
MRSILYLLPLCLFALTGCFQADHSNQKQAASTNSNGNSTSNALIVYFSKPEMNGTDIVAGASRVVSENDQILGNVEQLADWISEATNYPTARIETVETYPDDHDTLVDQATEERSTDFRPELKPLDANLADYNTIYIGYPIWWSDMPMAMYSFFETNDFSGKAIIPFSVHGGSGLTGTVETIDKLASGATVESDNVLSVSRHDVPEAQGEVKDWLKSLGVN